MVTVFSYTRKICGVSSVRVVYKQIQAPFRKNYERLCECESVKRRLYEGVYTGAEAPLVGAI